MGFDAGWLGPDTVAVEGDLLGWIKRRVPVRELVEKALGVRPPGRRGPKGYDRLKLTLCLLAGLVERVPDFTALAKRLATDDHFAARCGFGTEERRPAHDALGRHFAALAGAGFGELLMNELARLAMRRGLVTGEVLAVDSTAIAAREGRVGRATFQSAAEGGCHEAPGQEDRRADRGRLLRARDLLL